MQRSAQMILAGADAASPWRPNQRQPTSCLRPDTCPRLSSPAASADISQSFVSLAYSTAACLGMSDLEMTLDSHDSPDAEGQPSSAQASRGKARRVLACVACQQRKVRCDRKFPCSNCTKADVECVPATQAPRRRRRQFPERQLLTRLAKYEELMRHHGIDFTSVQRQIPLRPGETAESQPGDDRQNSTTEEQSYSTPGSDHKQSRSFWGALNAEFRNPDSQDNSSDDECLESTIHNEWEQTYENNDHVFCQPGTAVNRSLTAMHPDPACIFQLWQVFIDNVNPICKVLHIPTIQPKIVAAIGDLSNLNPELEALLFAIYCAAIMTLTDQECQKLFGNGKKNIVDRYQRGCQLALVNANFLRSDDLTVLTSLLYYTISLHQNADPRSLSVIFGIAVRIAQRLGIHSEPCNLNMSPFEAEMRRRIWWQLVLFDSRVSELAHSKSTILNSTWDCGIPRNVSDSDLHPQLNTLPASLPGPTESLFLAVSCEVAQTVRLSNFYQSLFTPGELASGNKESVGPHELETLERTIKAKYKAHRGSQAPLHLLTFYINDIHISRWRLADSVCNPGGLADPEYRETIFRHAIRMIESDSTIHSFPLMRGYRWLLKLNVPFPAYVYVIKELRRRTFTPIVEHAWNSLATNFEVRGLLNLPSLSPVLQSFRQMAMKAWESQCNNVPAGQSLIKPPRLISLFDATEPIEDQITDMMLGDSSNGVEESRTFSFSSLQTSDHASYEPLNGTDFSELRFEQFQPWTDTSGWDFTSNDVATSVSMYDYTGSGGLGNSQIDIVDPLWQWS